MSANANETPQRVWDLPTRLFHWLLVVLIAIQYATGEFHWLDMDWHMRFGYATLALLLFRVLWGVAGSQTSRFSDFVRGPRAVWSYLRSQFSTNPQGSIGHNPLGGWSVLAVLACIGVQALSGLFSSDDIVTEGPLAKHVSDATVKLMTRVHHWNENVLVLLIVLHVAVVLGYLLIARVDLIRPMISGRKSLAHTALFRFAPWWRALLLLAVAIAVVTALVNYS
ncbi:MAG: cytochrome b/b6 domain-containing protein [Rudaea sp.]